MKYIVDKINEVIKDGNLKDAYVSMFPRVFRYSDKHSIGNDSFSDLELSFDLECIARNAGGAKIGDGVLAVAKSATSEYYSMFSCVIVAEVGKMEDWKLKGGKDWKFGYKIVPLSRIVSLHSAVIESIIGVRLNKSLFNGLSFKSSSFRISQNGKALKALFDYCIDADPNK